MQVRVFHRLCQRQSDPSYSSVPNSYKHVGRSQSPRTYCLQMVLSRVIRVFIYPLCYYFTSFSQLAFCLSPPSSCPF
jgi:hypothetical protein